MCKKVGGMKSCGQWGSLPPEGEGQFVKNAVGAGLCSARGRLPCEKLSRKSVATSGRRAEQSPAPTNPQQRRYSYPGVRYFFDSLSFPLRGKPSLPPNFHKAAPFLRNRKSCAFALFIFIANKSKTIPRQNSSPLVRLSTLQNSKICAISLYSCSCRSTPSAAACAAVPHGLSLLFMQNVTAV